MLGLKKVSILLMFIGLVAVSCKKANQLTTLSDFISKDDSDQKIPRDYKTWVLEGAEIAQEGKPTIVYKKGQAIQSNFDPSKISFVFSANNSYQGTDEKGKPESGQWKIEDTTKKLFLSTTTAADSFEIIQITRNNLDIKNNELVEGKPTVVTLKLVPKK
jgi:hypothetical protein